MALWKEWKDRSGQPEQRLFQFVYLYYYYASRIDDRKNKNTGSSAGGATLNKIFEKLGMLQEGESKLSQGWNKSLLCASEVVTTTKVYHDTNGGEKEALFSKETKNKQQMTRSLGKL